MELSEFDGIYAPTGSKVVPFMVAEQADDIYLTRMIKPGEVVLDIGACIGLYTKKAVEAGAGTVYAVEPYAPNVKALVCNVAQYMPHKVLVYQTGVWSSPGKRSLVVPQANTGAASMVMPVMGLTVDVLVTTIDLMMATSTGRSKLDWIKIDAEGAELDILIGAAYVLRHMCPKVVIAAEHYNYQQMDIIEFFRDKAPWYHVSVHPPCTQDMDQSSRILLFTCD